MYSAILTIVLSSTGLSASAQNPIHIDVNQPRPLEAAIDRLEKQIGIPIDYEDPRYDCSRDVQDVTSQVQNAAQKAAHPNARIVVPVRGRIVMDSVVSSTPQSSDAFTLLTLLRVQYEAKHYPGRFAIKQVGSVPTVEPVSARGSNCKWSAVEPAMETRISFPSQAKDASEMLTIVLSALSRQLGVKVGLGSLPMLAFVKRTVTLGANNEPANGVLVRLFEQVSASGRSYFSYHVFYDPGLKYYLADIGAVQPRISSPRSLFDLHGPVIVMPGGKAIAR